MTQKPVKLILKTLMVHENMSKPLVLVFAGPNGSGKSTITKLLPQCGVYVNADDLKKEYSLTDTERNLLLLRKAKENGYEIYCIYVLTCHADINVARVRSRVCEGGHDVAEDKIRSRYIKALELLPQIINVCDKILVYDNSTVPLLIFKKDEEGNNYFPTDLWSVEKLKDLLKH